MYHFRDIICYKCNHKFLHLAHSIPGNSSYYEYYTADTDELLDYAICPKCSAEMVIYKNSHIGVNPDSEGIIKTRVYGI